MYTKITNTMTNEEIENAFLSQLKRRNPALTSIIVYERSYYEKEGYNLLYFDTIIKMLKGCTFNNVHYYPQLDTNIDIMIYNINLINNKEMKISFLCYIREE